MIEHKLTFFHHSMPDMTPQLQARVISRVMDFELEHNLFGSPLGMASAVADAFWQAKPHICTLLMVHPFTHDDGRKEFLYPVGHMVGSCDLWWNEMYLNLHQLQVDRWARIPPEVGNEYFQVMITWGVNEWGAKYIRALADSPALARVYKMYHNLPNNGRIVCEAPIEEVCLGYSRRDDQRAGDRDVQERPPSGDGGSDCRVNGDSAGGAMVYGDGTVL